MKLLNIKCWVAGLLLTTVFSSCTDMDENLYDEVSADDTEFTVDDLPTIIGPAYISMRELYWGWEGMLDIYEESSDLIVTPYRVSIGWGDLYLDMHKHSWGPTINHANNMWVRAYNGITECNKAIYIIENLEDAGNTDAEIYELRALRAFYYYLLYDNFRNIPIVKRYDVPDGFIPEQEESADVYKFVESELLEAMPYLSEENNVETYGRFTTWAAKMTLAKLYLNSSVYIQQARWDDAIKQIDDIIASGKFDLLPSYADNFAVENENNAEEIFSIPFDSKYSSINTHYPQKTLYKLSSQTFNMPEPWGGSCAIPQFIDTYDEEDSRLTDSWLGGLQYTASDEPLMDGAKQFEYTNYLTSVDSAYYWEGYRFVKYEIPVGWSLAPGNDIPMFRYADALMIKAECLLRKGLSDEAAQLVTRVRERNFKTNPDKAVVTGAQLQGGSTYQYGEYLEGKVINPEGGADIQYGRFLDELAWEFVGEHHRKQDLIRFGVYTTKSWLQKKPSDPYRIIFPIPEPQRNANPNLVQNPGYN
ncbi:RagB/SusD family nutrient uptake outer membrane protein [Fulvivirga sediminis]|uniref:RagB/SusD family nutrient uptake outer membrane protein n=1 Tax=Fulvivirga sediminis TaxID=2803949 RepID=A0A937F671_9BACT|nr:RagB/SusD family nutrient uptake outer membrane protein [Fulvivirga sediminis]MBL3657126.1 RagB/SusD family nutrient uptake outer membrane protein [Fulvivirga sediminis]